MLTPTASSMTWAWIAATLPVWLGEEAERRFPLPAEGQDTRGFAKTSARSLELALAGQR